MRAKNEVTSKKVAAIAGRILRRMAKANRGICVYIWAGEYSFLVGTVGELKAIAEFVQQAADCKPAPKRKAKRA